MNRRNFLTTSAATLACTIATRAQEAEPSRIQILVRAGRLYVEAAVGARKTLLLIDTGASESAFVFGLVPEHRGTAPGSRELKSAFGQANCPQLDVPVVLEGKGASNDVRKIVSGVFGPFDFGVAKGVLGMDFLGQYSSVKFDMKNQEMVLEK